MKTITKAEHHQLLGIATLAARKNQMLRELEQIAAEILGVAEDGCGYLGHASDLIMQAGDDPQAEVAHVLRCLAITVAE